jgi:hypothetical protein
MTKLGRVSGFILVADEQEVQFTNLAVLANEAKKIGGKYKIYTIFEDYDGNEERQAGWCILAEVGTFASKLDCNTCGNPIGWITRGMPNPVRGLCHNCLRQEQGDADIDVDSYLDRMSKLDEY